MEAPGDDELEWMAREHHRAMEEEEEEVLMDQVFFDQTQLPRHSDAFDAAVQGLNVDAHDATELLGRQDFPVKRKTLVFPDFCASPIKSRRISVDSGRENLHSEIAFEVEEEKEMINLVDDSCVRNNFLGESSVAHEQSTEKTVTGRMGEQRFSYKHAADIAGELIPITGPSGERVYAELNRDFSSSKLVACASKEDKLLSMSVDKMIEQVENELLQQTCALENAKDMDVASVEKNDELWVNKYAPKSFTELLSDEQINRKALGWLKEWDLCVYGARRLSTPKEVLKALQEDKHEHPSNLKTKNTSHLHVNKTVLQDRPDQKVLILCGPPGLGKTTLAHVVAKHCGYRVVEINASDDRTATSFQAKILDAIQMKPVTGDSKPNCLIIDEIDGAVHGMEGKSGVSFLVDLVNAEPGAEQKAKSHKKKTGISRLSRPIICICNDLYAPALRPLREIARIFSFFPPAPHRIVTRLNFICKLEGYKVDARALTALAVHTESDIRSCLNTLQFLHRNGKALKTLDVASQVIGKKDMTSSMFDIWLETFWKKNNTKLGQAQAEFSRLHEVFANHGEYDLGMEGIFENFLHVHYHDAYLQKTIACLDLIAESDLVGRQAFSQQKFFLNVYRPSYKLAIRRLISQPLRPKLEWPKSFQRNRQQCTANTEILKSWLNLMAPAVSRSIFCDFLIQDVLSPLLSIVAPSLRPVASNLLSQQEREELKQLVDTMITYGLRYKKSTTDTFTANNFLPETFSLDPPLYDFIKFKEYRHSHGELSRTIQQMVSHEVELEVIKRETSRRASRTCEPSQKVACVSETKATLSETFVIQKATVSTSAFKTSTVSKAAIVKTKTVVKKAGFFERFKLMSVDSESSSSVEVATAKRNSRPFLFKFHEGFTNAVKKPVFMRDLL